MKIFGSDSGFFKKDRVGDSGKSGKVEAKSAEAAKAKLAGDVTGGGESEKIAVSNLGKEIAKVHAKVKSSPDVRVDKVKAIKEQIDAGTYKVPSEKIADKIIEDILLQGK